MTPGKRYCLIRGSPSSFSAVCVGIDDKKCYTFIHSHISAFKIIFIQREKTKNNNRNLQQTRTRNPLKPVSNTYFLPVGPPWVYRCNTPLTPAFRHSPGVPLVCRCDTPLTPAFRHSPGVPLVCRCDIPLAPAFLHSPGVPLVGRCDTPLAPAFVNSGPPDLSSRHCLLSPCKWPHPDPGRDFRY